MANYFSDGVADVPFLADEDLSSWQYRLVMTASTAGYVQKFDILTTAASPRWPIGVLTNDPSLGQEAAVKCFGFTKAVGSVGGCYLGQGGLLTACNSGALHSASEDSDDPIFGYWFGPAVTSGSAVGNVLLIPTAPSSLQMLNTTN